MFISLHGLLAIGFDIWEVSLINRVYLEVLLAIDKVSIAPKEPSSFWLLQPSALESNPPELITCISPVLSYLQRTSTTVSITVLNVSIGSRTFRYLTNSLHPAASSTYTW